RLAVLELQAQPHAPGDRRRRGEPARWDRRHRPFHVRVGLALSGGHPEQRDLRARAWRRHRPVPPHGRRRPRQAHRPLPPHLHGVRDALVRLIKALGSLLEVSALGRTLTEGLVTRVPVLSAGLYRYDATADRFTRLAQATSDAADAPTASPVLDKAVARWLTK